MQTGTGTPAEIATEVALSSRRTNAASPTSVPATRTAGTAGAATIASAGPTSATSNAAMVLQAHGVAGALGLIVGIVL